MSNKNIMVGAQVIQKLYIHILEISLKNFYGASYMPNKHTISFHNKLDYARC